MEKAEIAELEQDFRRAIELEGNKIGMKSAECAIWQKSHENCTGCPYELGCCQFVALQLVTFDTDPYGKVDKILNTKDPAVIKAINYTFPDEDYY